MALAHPECPSLVRRSLPLTLKLRLILFAVLTLLVGGWFLWMTFQLPSAEQVSTLIGPRFWPASILFVMLPLAALMLGIVIVRGTLSRDHAHELAAQAKEVAHGEDGSMGTVLHRYRWLVVLALTILYTVAMEYTGYLVATLVYAVVLSLILGERVWWRFALVLAVAGVMVALVFDRLLEIPLP